MLNAKGLESCPGCGSAEVKLISSSLVDWNFVMCVRCRTNGCVFHTRVDGELALEYAKDAWNRMSRLAQAGQLLVDAYSAAEESQSVRWEDLDFAYAVATGQSSVADTRKEHDNHG